MTETWMLILYALAFGALIGQASMFDAAVWANMYGRQYQGAIRGFVATVGVGGSALGPVIFGLCYDLTGSYTVILVVSAALALIPGILSLFMNLPQEHPQLAASPAVGD
jgi:MFS-type transporter involved in bile tolerance (Atg22 family)